MRQQGTSQRHVDRENVRPAEKSQESRDDRVVNYRSCSRQGNHQYNQHASTGCCAIATRLLRTQLSPALAVPTQTAAPTQDVGSYGHVHDSRDNSFLHTHRILTHMFNLIPYEYAALDVAD